MRALSMSRERRDQTSGAWAVGFLSTSHVAAWTVVSALPVLVSAAAGAGLEEIHFQMSEVTLNLRDDNSSLGTQVHLN